MLLIPFSSVWAELSEDPATAHAASARATNEDESHIFVVATSVLIMGKSLYDKTLLPLE